MTVLETIFARTEDTTMTTPQPHGLVDPWGPDAEDEAHIVRGLD